MAAVADPRLRQLKIKTGVLKRLSKEKTMYEKEVVDQGQKVEKMKAEGKDSHDVNKQIEVLEESKIMIPDCKRRIKTAYEDLKNLVSESEKDLDGSEELKQAKAILGETVLEN
ncbi:tubulin-specific chaperone A-like [Actinia tenebrosa]|uniref:Tubulin-specific chaperone A n=1 Tax=Actinia tenebrosa TaxID=6105 RepID=A0A6P8J110_ACTTE|nr:tubulin-specific chaperone A-like [Actinia tenebrosa]